MTTATMTAIETLAINLLAEHSSTFKADAGFSAKWNDACNNIADVLAGKFIETFDNDIMGDEIDAAISLYRGIADADEKYSFKILGNLYDFAIQIARFRKHHDEIVLADDIRAYLRIRDNFRSQNEMRLRGKSC